MRVRAIVRAFSPLLRAGHLPPHTRPNRHQLPTQTTNRISHQTRNSAGKTKKKGSLGYPFLFEVSFSPIARFYPPNTCTRSRTCVRLIFIFICFLGSASHRPPPTSNHLLPRRNHMLRRPPPTSNHLLLGRNHTLWRPTLVPDSLAPTLGVAGQPPSLSCSPPLFYIYISVFFK